MNIRQIRSAAESKCSKLGDPSLIRIYVGASSDDPDAGRILGLLQSAVDQGRLSARLVRTGSFGYYDLEPIVTVERPGRDTVVYGNVTPDTVAGLLEDPTGGSGDISGLPSLNLQNRIALRNCGWIDPEDINHYIMHGQGYSGLAKALGTDRRDLIKTLISAIKGRGGPGCSVPDKWSRFCASENADKHLICYAVDQDPGSLTSRLLLESDPHSVLEGMLISAYAAGAAHCLIFVKDETEVSGKLKKALDQMRSYGLLGANILDSPFFAEMTIEEAPASMTSGHTIELLRCLEENQPLPHILPIPPAVSELMGKPVFVLNPESMSSISAALLDGMGERQGSKVVTLSGSVNYKRTVEVSSDATIRNIIECLGGGVPDGKAIQAVQLGGRTGPFIGPESIDLQIGSSPCEGWSPDNGSGAIEVLDADCRMADKLKDVMAWLQAQSCGKCVFCREGCLQMLTILEDISENRSKPEDLDLLAELGEQMKTACLCAFGRSAPIPVSSGFRVPVRVRHPKKR